VQAPSRNSTVVSTPTVIASESRRACGDINRMDQEMLKTPGGDHRQDACSRKQASASRSVLPAR